VAKTSNGELNIGMRVARNSRWDNTGSSWLICFAGDFRADYSFL
jgi:hypothetical protein